MIVTSGYCVMLVAGRIVYRVSWQLKKLIHKLDLNKEVLLTVNLKKRFI